MNTTPSMSATERGNKRRIILPVSEEIIANEDVDAKENALILNIGTKLEAFKDTFDISMAAALQNMKDQFSKYLEKFKEDIVAILEEKCNKHKIRE